MFFFDTAEARQEESQSCVKSVGNVLLGARGRVQFLATRHVAGLKTHRSTSQYICDRLSTTYPAYCIYR